MTEIKMLENQKIIADTISVPISVPLSKKELELLIYLIYKLSDMPITNKQALNIYKKLIRKLETLEQNNELMNETENKKFENERYLYVYAHVYGPYTFSEPKLHEMGYFTNNMEAFDNLKDPELYYAYGELIDYNEDCEGHYYIDDDNEDYEGRYYCEGAEYVDAWLDEVSLDGNYAFYIPESSIPQEKREWYRSNALNWR